MQCCRSRGWHVSLHCILKITFVISPSVTKNLLSNVKLKTSWWQIYFPKFEFSLESKILSLVTKSVAFLKWGVHLYLCFKSCAKHSNLNNYSVSANASYKKKWWTIKKNPVNSTCNSIAQVVFTFSLFLLLMLLQMSLFSPPLPTSPQPPPPSLYPSPHHCLCLWVLHICSLVNPFIFLKTAIILWDAKEVLYVNFPFCHTKHYKYMSSRFEMQ